MSNSSFGSRLKSLRKKAGLTQEELANLIGVHEISIRRWELSQRQPKLEDIKQLANALHCSENDLINDSAPDNSGWCLTINIQHDFKKEVIDMSAKVPCVSSITTTPQGALLTLGGDYSHWTDDNQFKKLITDLKKFRATVIQNGIAFGGIKKNEA